MRDRIPHAATVPMGRYDGYAALPPMPHDLHRPVYACLALQWLRGPVASFVVKPHLWDELDNFESRFTEALPQTIIAGPGVLWAYLGNTIIWVFFVVYTIYATGQAYCADGNNASNIEYAKYPLYVWVPFAFMLGLCLFCELKSLAYVLIPQVQVTEKFMMLFCIDFSKLPFGVWLSMMLSYSIFSHVDFATNALFVATTQKSFTTCGAKDNMQMAWQETIAKSWVSYVPYAHEFDSIVQFCWCLMLLQGVFAVLDAVPVLPCFVDYGCGGGFHRRYTYRTVIHREQNHGAALASLQVVGRMSSAAFQAEVYARRKFQARYAELQAILVRGQDVREAKAKWTVCKDHARGQLCRGIIVFGLIGVCESGLFLHAQLSLAALVCAVTGQPVTSNQQILFSLVLSFAMAFKRVFDAILALWFNCKQASDLKESAEGLDRQIQDAHVNNERRLRLFFSIYVAYIALLLWAVGKLVALFVCPHGLWNFSGCVELEQLDEFPSSRGTDAQVYHAVVFGCVCNFGLIVALLSGWCLYMRFTNRRR